jgi:ankyrin repeat protein
MPKYENSNASPDEKAFVIAAAEGRVEEVKRLLAKGVAVDVLNIEHFRLPGWVGDTTALMQAAFTGQLEVVRTLLAAGADVCATSMAGKPDGGGGSQAIHFAIVGGHQSVVEALLEAGADPNVVGNFCCSPLGLAISSGNFDMVRLLLRKGADIKLRTRKSDYDPPLIVAIHGKHSSAMKVEMVRFLLDSGADPNAVSALMKSPLMAAAAAKAVDLPDSDCVTMIQELLRGGASLDYTNPKYGFSALESAVLGGRPEIVKLLLQSGANANRITKNRGSTLDIALRLLEQAQSVVAKPPDPMLRPRDMIEADLRNSQAVVDHLREHGAKAESELPAAAPEKKKPPRAAAATKNGTCVGAADFLAFINAGEPEYSIIAVRAPIERTTAEFSALRGGVKAYHDVSRKRRTIEADALAWLVPIVEVKSSDWTIIYRSILYVKLEDYEGAATEAQALSARLHTRTLSIVGEDEETGVSIYTMFDNGKVVSRVEWDEPKKFPHRRLAKEGICLPACYPKDEGGERWLVVLKESEECVVRADLVEIK